jgi:hypothetical protein
VIGNDCDGARAPGRGLFFTSKEGVWPGFLGPFLRVVVLRAIKGLRKGRTGAREDEKVMPVADGHFEAVKPHVSGQVWTMIELQRLTGMRPGEVCVMRTGDIAMTGGMWA